MNVAFRKKNQLGLAIAAALATMATAPVALAAKTPGKYVAGDVHNHTTCSDGSISMQKLIKKSTDKVDTPWGLDWFVQAGHGGNGNRNCTLVEDASLSTPAYPYVSTQGPTTTWENSGVVPKGVVSGTSPSRNMWRWQSIQEFQYPLVEYLAAYKNQPMFIGVETVAPGHEHVSASVITGQMPAALDSATLPTVPGYAALGNANAMAQWEYCFDRNDTDTSRGVSNAWDCSVPGSANSADANWNATAMKLIPATGTGVGTRGHAKSLEGVKWMSTYAQNGAYYMPTHLERAGQFNPDGNNGFNIEHLRNFNNAAPTVAFGFETQPGHGASDARGEYTVKRNSFACTGALTAPGQTTSTTNPDGSVCKVTVASTATASSTVGTMSIDSVGGTTYGGTGVYGAVVGGVWDALLGEGRNFWFFASSDWHNRGSFGADDRRSTQDFLPGEYQRSYTMVRNGSDKLRPQTIVDGMRSGNVFTSSGQLIDRLAFVACASYPGIGARTNAQVEAWAVNAAINNTDIDVANCATMGEKLKVRPGAEIVISVVARDPAGTNYAPYTFANPSLAQVGITQPLNQPVLDHVDLIRGLVTGYKTPGAPDYSGEWPRNNTWLKADGTTADLSVVPAAAKNTSAAVIRTFNTNGSAAWTAFNSSVDGTQFLKMTYRIPAVSASQYVRLRGTNLPPAVPYETDANGNPLADIYTNAIDKTMLRIPCTTAHSANSQFDGCPDHLATATSPATGDANPIAGQKAVSYDVAAWSDLWFYSNPIYVEVSGGTLVAGLK
ncbi:MAG: hypothetical protein QM709_15110 [Spongiibacteraceae bacterium]